MRAHYPTVVMLMGAVVMGCSNLTQAASAIPPTENIHYLAEHLVEAAQDTRYFALPWTMAAGPQDTWYPVVSVAGADFGTDLANAKGGLLTVGIERNWSATTRYSLLAFYDRFTVYGGTSENVLTAGPIANPPLDIPEYAMFSHPEGRFTHSGLGLIVRHTNQNPSADGWGLVWGVLLERLTLSDYRFNYHLTSGADAGAEGQFVYGGSNNYFNPFIGGQYHYTLNSRFSLLPRIAVGVPLPSGNMNTRMTGPGFDFTDDSSGGDKIHIGDGYLVAGLGVYDQNTHLEFEFGTDITFPVLERLTHEGVSRGVLLSVTWRGIGE